MARIFFPILVFLISLSNVSSGISLEDFGSITVFVPKENVFVKKNLFEMWSSQDLDYKMFLKNYFFIVLYRQNNNESGLNSQKVLNKFHHFWMYAEKYGILLCEVHCNEMNSLCNNRYLDELYDDFTEMLTLNFKHPDTNIFVTAIKKSMAKFYAISEEGSEESSVKSFISRKKKVPFLVAHNVVFDSLGYLWLLELTNTFKTSFQVACFEANPDNEENDEPYIKVYDPRICTVDNPDDCIKWMFQPSLLSDNKTIEIACATALSIWDNRTIIDARKESSKNISNVVRLIFKFCPYTVVISGETDLQDVIMSINQTFRHIMGFAIVKLNKEQLFHLKNDIDNDFLNSPLHFYTLFTKNLTPVGFTSEALTAREAINFVKDQITIASIFMDTKIKPDFLILDQNYQQDFPYFASLDEFSNLPLNEKLHLEDMEDVIVTDLQQLESKFDIHDIVGVLFYQSWDALNKAVIYYLMKADNLLQSAISDWNCKSNSVHNMMQCSKPNPALKKVAIFLTNCFDSNVVCNHFQITTYPTLYFYQKSQQSQGLKLLLNYTEVFSVNNLYKTLQLLRYSDVSISFFSEALEEIHTTKLARRFILGVNLIPNSKASEQFENLSRVYVGKELFLKAHIEMLPQKFQDEINSQQIVLPAIVLVKLAPYFKVSVIEVENLLSETFETFLHSLRYDNLIPMEELSASDMIKYKKPILILFSRELTDDLLETMATLTEILKTWSKLDNIFHKKMFYKYGCKKTPCLVLNDIPNKRVFVFASPILSVKSIMQWISTIKMNKIESNYNYKTKQFNPPGPSIDVTQIIYNDIEIENKN